MSASFDRITGRMELGLTIRAGCAHITCMSRNVNLDDEAVAALEAHRRGNESFSKVVKRLAPPPIRTFGDLEKFLEELEGPLLPDLEVLRRVRERRTKGRDAH
jgi:predicted CopG family antitoxin